MRSDESQARQGGEWEAAAPADAMPRPFRPTSAGLTFRCAETIEEVLAAWHLVYNAYRRQNLIPANRQQVFTTQSAVTPQSLVLIGQIGPVIVSTLTATVEHPLGFVSQHGGERPGLELRRPGRRVLELHLSADRREGEDRATDALLQMMALAWTWGVEHRSTDWVMAVSPARVGYFRHAFGFEPLGEASRARSMPGSWQTPMWCDVTRALSLASPPVGLRFLAAQAPPTAAGAGPLDRRYSFHPGEVAGSAIGDFLCEKYGVRAAG